MFEDETAILYQALSAEIGVAIEVEDFDKARARLYTVRRKLGDPALASLQIRRGLNGQLWLVKSQPLGQ